MVAEHSARLSRLMLGLVRRFGLHPLLIARHCIGASLSHSPCEWQLVFECAALHRLAESLAIWVAVIVFECAAGAVV